MSGQPAAKEGDQITATDTHIVMIPSPGGPVPTPLPHPFVGTLQDALSEDVQVMNKKAAVVGSKAKNTPHVPQGGPFQKPPKDEATVAVGSNKVLINNKAAARANDKALTCNDPADVPIGTVVAAGTVVMG